MLATVATVVAVRRFGCSSASAAVAVPVVSPTENPESARPSSSPGSVCQSRKTSVLATATPTASASTGRRPTRSDSPPNSSSAASVPTA
jgi:hypothetical protein